MIPEDELLYHPHRRCSPLLHREKTLYTPTILYVEHNRLLRSTVSDVLELAGWKVEHCHDGNMAFVMLDSAMRFDLLLLDNEIHYTSGLQLAKLARRLEHRCQTPIVITSIEDCARQAREAGANEFLQKPNNLLQLVDIIGRLLSARSQPSTQK